MICEFTLVYRTKHRTLYYIAADKIMSMTEAGSLADATTIELMSGSTVTVVGSPSANRAIWETALNNQLCAQKCRNK